MYTTGSGIQIPQGTDAFNPPAQFRTWADGDDVFNNALNVNLDSERTALAPPKLRDGVLCYVRATKTLWSYQGTTWVRLWSPNTPFQVGAGVGSIAFGGVSQAFSLTLPTGLFTQAPLITIMTHNNAYGTTFSGVATSPTNVEVLGSSGQAGLTVPYQWIAVQMVA